MTVRTQRDDDGDHEAPLDDDIEQDEGGWKQALAAGLPRLRRRRHWTQHELADACGLHRETISRLERPGRRQGEPVHGTLRALALAFNHDDLAGFWTALCGAAAEASSGVWARLDLRQHELITKLGECTPEQQELVHVLIAFFRAQLHPQLPGSEPLRDVETLLALLKQRPRRL